MFGAIAQSPTSAYGKGSILHPADRYGPRWSQSGLIYVDNLAPPSKGLQHRAQDRLKNSTEPLWKTPSSLPPNHSDCSDTDTLARLSHKGAQSATVPLSFSHWALLSDGVVVRQSEYLGLDKLDLSGSSLLTRN